MKFPRPTPKDPPTPRIVIGARILAALSVIWSGYAISDLMHSGPWGITVAVAGDIGWITVLWAEANRVRVYGYTWPAVVSGWLIAAGVGVLLAVHGAEGPDGSWAQAMAGVLVIAVSKIVWLFALAATVDPAALTSEQEAEIDEVIRDSEYVARMERARSDGEIARINEEARTTLARDEADFQIMLERIHKRAEIDRRTPLALTASHRPVEQSAEEPPALPATPRKRQPPSDPAGPNGQVIKDTAPLFADAHAPVVYFLRNGGRVKIGTSQNLRRRITSLSLRREDVIRVEHGTQDYERSLHRRFAALRIGETEWFELSGELAAYLGEPEAQPVIEPAEPMAQSAVSSPAEPGEPTPPRPAVVLPSPQAAAPEPPAQPREPEGRPFGFSAHLSAQSAQRAEGVAKVAELLAQDSGLTSGQVAELLSVSPATAKRYLREARQGRL